MSSITNQTSRVLELIKRFNNGEKVCIDRLKDDSLWYGKSEKTIRRDLDVIKEYFPDSFELIRGEKGCYKAITKHTFDNFMSKDTISLLVQTFNLAQNYNILESLNISSSDKRIINNKIEKSRDCYVFISKPYETKKGDEELLRDIEKSINGKRYVSLKYNVNYNEKQYEVKPYKIVFINEIFYLACENNSDEFPFTMFRISNITDYKMNTKTFHLNPDILSFIKQIQTPFSKYSSNFRTNLIEARVEVNNLKSRFFETKKFLPSQQIINKTVEGNLIISFTVTQEMEVEDLIKRWIPHIKVLSPLSLKLKIKEDLLKYLEIVKD